MAESSQLPHEQRPRYGRFRGRHVTISTQRGMAAAPCSRRSSTLTRISMIRRARPGSPGSKDDPFLYRRTLPADYEAVRARGGDGHRGGEASPWLGGQPMGAMDWSASRSVDCRAGRPPDSRRRGFPQARRAIPQESVISRHSHRSERAEAGAADNNSAPTLATGRHDLELDVIGERKRSRMSPVGKGDSRACGS